MAENIFFTTDIEHRAERFQEFWPQFVALISGEKDEIATFANAAAAIMEAFQFHWVGFYFVKDNELVLGPFQGTIACTRIKKGKGVCGTAWAQQKAILVPDVDAFPGHIACSSLSKSELVLPLFDAQNEVYAVLDIDSDQLNDFSESDITQFSQLVAYISSHLQL